jgi:ribonucleoside-diphosphate reductase alpha chain
MASRPTQHEPSAGGGRGPETRSSVDLEREARAALEALDPPADLADPDLAPNAHTVLERRYLLRDAGGALIETARQLFWRVASHVAKGSIACGSTVEEAVAVARDYYTQMAERKFLPNSPCLTNAGRRDGMLSACFVLPVEDSVEGIFDAVKATALIQKAGGGTGFSFSRLRPAGDRVESSGGQGAGPLAFMEVFSKTSDSITQGAFRKGANMGILRIDHPDIGQFVVYKDDRSKLTNYNISVAVTDRFLAELRRDPKTVHEVQNPRTKAWTQLAKRDAKGKTMLGADGQPVLWTVGELWDAIIEHAHRSGEPGVIFIDRINATNPIKNVGEIEATNPCGEQPLHAWDSCNLGSINLGRFVQVDGDDTRFDWAGFRESIHTCTRFLDDVIEVNHYPLRQIEEMSRATRRIGLGVMGFADVLYMLGIPYDTVEGCDFGAEVMRVLQEESHLASEILAEERGVFSAWEGSEWAMRGQRMRNSYTTTIAPTGTISIIAGCSGGIEPLYSLAFTRQVMRDKEGVPTTMREVNPVFERAAQAAGYFSDELIDRIARDGTLHDIAEVPAEHRRIFVTAHDIAPEWHMRMQAAFQRNCDASISKTINFPNEAKVEDVRAIYDLAIDLDVKGVTVYRDGCRDFQPMALEGSKRAADTAPATSAPTAAAPGPETGFFLRGSGGAPMLAPVKLPEIMPSLRIRQMTPFGNMHVKVSVDPRLDCEREVFAQLGKGGDVANSDLEAICRILSLWLRSNGSLETAVNQLSGIGSSLSVPTKDGRIMSLADGLATALRRYLDAKAQHGLEALLLGRVDAGAMAANESANANGKHPNGHGHGAPRSVARYKIVCPQCSAALNFSEGCVKCESWGFSQC